MHDRNSTVALFHTAALTQATTEYTTATSRLNAAINNFDNEKYLNQLAETQRSALLTQIYALNGDLNRLFRENHTNKDTVTELTRIIATVLSSLDALQANDHAALQQHLKTIDQHAQIAYKQQHDPFWKRVADTLYTIAQLVALTALSVAFFTGAVFCGLLALPAAPVAATVPWAIVFVSSLLGLGGAGVMTGVAYGITKNVHPNQLGHHLGLFSATVKACAGPAMEAPPLSLST